MSEFKHESFQDRDTIVNYLESLTQGFENGLLTFTSDKEKIKLTPNGLLNLLVKVKKKGDKSKLTIQLKWKEKN